MNGASMRGRLIKKPLLRLYRSTHKGLRLFRKPQIVIVEKRYKRGCALPDRPVAGGQREGLHAHRADRRIGHPVKMALLRLWLQQFHHPLQ